MRVFIITSLLLLISHAVLAHPLASRYHYHGDGKLSLRSAKSGASFSGTFRHADGTYDATAIKRIHQVFSANADQPVSQLSPRFLAFLDFLQDAFRQDGRITIHSGYRSPRYNTNLRNNGKLAAKASLHQYGMAADISLQGIPSKRMWEFVKELGFGGAGYYAGKTVHVDVGPARSWDQHTSGVGTGISDDNKLIGIIAEKDIYLPGELVDMRFIRMTAFPVNVDPTFTLERKDAKQGWKEVETFHPTFARVTSGSCPAFQSIEEMLGVRWTLPQKLPAGVYRIRASFCTKSSESMPDAVFTDPFEVRLP